MSVDIILGTYNGEPYLREQIESILAQTETRWHLLIRDDGSKDNTVAIITDYAQLYPEKIRHVDVRGDNLGVVANFSRLMEFTDAPYVMFCDQDDRWYPDKITLTLQAIKAMERRDGSNTPLLVHTDARLVDAQMKPTHASFHQALAHNMSVQNLAYELVQNTAHGCTMMLNRALIKHVLPIPSQARMHDMWVHILVLALGHSQYLDISTLDYRQHGNNVIGALPQSHDMGQARRKARKTIDASVAQAQAVLERITQTDGQAAQKLLIDFIAACRAHWLVGTVKLLRTHCPQPRFKNALRILLR